MNSPSKEWIQGNNNCRFLLLADLSMSNMVCPWYNDRFIDKLVNLEFCPLFLNTFLRFISYISLNNRIKFFLYYIEYLWIPWYHYTNFTKSMVIILYKEYSSFHFVLKTTYMKLSYHTIVLHLFYGCQRKSSFRTIL